MRDIQNLRSVSTAWRRLPQSLYRDTVLEEMPWLWEAEELARSGTKVQWFGLWYQCTQADGGEGRPAKELDEVQGKGSSKTEARAGRPFVTFSCLFDHTGKRVNGLVNRKRIWKAAEVLTLKMREALMADG